MNYLNSIKNLIIKNKIVSILILIAVISSGGFLGFKIYKNKNNENNYFITESGQKLPKKIDNPDLDSDADGLRDWEEPLYNTDPHNADTDNDSYLDGEEIMSGYDPTRPSPNDKKSDYAMEPRLKPQTLTENLTERLFFTILEKKVSAEDANKILLSQELEQSQTYAAVGMAFEQLKTANQKTYSLPEITDAMITIAKDQSPKTLTEYENAERKIAEIIAEKNLTIDRITDAYYEAIKTKDFTITKKIKEAFKDLYNEFILVPVPINYIEDHKLKLTFFASIIQILSDIEDIENDPVKAAVSIEKTKNLMLLFSKIYENQTGEKIFDEQDFEQIWNEIQ